MKRTLIVKIGSRYFKVRVNPQRKNPNRSVHEIVSYINHLRDLQHRQKRGSEDHRKLGELVALERDRLKRKLKNNPLLKSPSKSAIGSNIAYLMKHQGELTAKTPAMRRKQAIAIALSTWRRAAGKPAYKRRRR